MNNQWNQSGSNFFVNETSSTIGSLPPGVYRVAITPQGIVYLEQMSDSFTFKSKIYGVETDLVNRVVKTYQHTTGNLGILMNGIKGTGKTLTAELICNKLQLPVIVVNEDVQGLVPFINGIQQEVVLFLDEYEKVFASEYGKSSRLLTVMDGVLKTTWRKVFLLTTNNLHIDDNLQQRPGRIRYLKQFTNLSPEIVMEIVRDKLVHKELENDTVKFIATLELITVDIVTSVVEEVNIHHEAPDKFASVFNVTKSRKEFDVTELIPGKKENEFFEEVFGRNIEVTPFEFGEDCIGDWIHLAKKRIGLIESVMDNGDLEVAPYGAKPGAPNRIFRIKPVPSYAKGMMTYFI